jgi:pimeloyl-ACP methyl ester carboxylesterase
VAASLHDWDALAPALAGSGFRALALDLLGHGDSAKPNDPEQYTHKGFYAHFASWLEELCLDEPPVLVGHSFGGYLSLLYALKNPGKVRQLVLINPLYDPNQLPPLVRLARRRPQLGETAMRFAPEWVYRFFVGLDPDVSEGKPDARRQIARDAKRASPHILRIARQLPSLEPRLDKLSTPSLIIWGEKDHTLAPPSFPRLVERIPNASGQPLPGCGHQPHICQPFMVNSLVLNFLS